MTTVQAGPAAAFAAAVVARDFVVARALLHPDVDFRGMTPNRIWEADGPADVEAHLRAWIADPDEEVHAVTATESVVVADTLRTGWRVEGTKASGPFVFEQQAYLREQDGQVSWLRVVCSGPRPPAGA